jgi:hypothetical protein
MFAAAQTEQVQLELLNGFPNNQMKTAVEQNVSGVLSSINQAFAQQAEPVFNRNCISETGINGINAMYSSAKFYCTKSKITATLSKIGGGYEIRGIPIHFFDAKEKEDDEIVIEVKADGSVEDIYIAMAVHQLANISVNNDVVSETQKNIILHFIEALRTAYVKKDMRFLEDAYSDKALIIVGRKITRTENSLSVSKDVNKEIYIGNTVYAKYSTEEYLSRLQQVFDKNEKIELKFSNIEVKQHEKKNLKNYYGVRLLQNWKATTYSDVGLLYFIIEFRENDNPLIWVRVWQDPKTDSLQQFWLGDYDIEQF